MNTRRLLRRVRLGAQRRRISASAPQTTTATEDAHGTDATGSSCPPPIAEVPREKRQRPVRAKAAPTPAKRSRTRNSNGVHEDTGDTEEQGKIAARGGTKRKSISERQLEELLKDERKPRQDLDEVVGDVVAGAVGQQSVAVAVSAPLSKAVEVRPCELCRKFHNAFMLYHCSACRRVYHDKCLVQSFQSEVHHEEPIEQQLERLRLHRPEGRGAVLRCQSCAAAFIDFFNNKGRHWDCSCPTCTSVPEKIVDYRSVMLRRIIEEHNTEVSRKKSAKAPGKAAAKKGAKASPSVEPVRTSTRATRSRGGIEAPQTADNSARAEQAAEVAVTAAKETKTPGGDVEMEEDPEPHSSLDDAHLVAESQERLDADVDETPVVVTDEDTLDAMPIDELVLQPLSKLTVGRLLAINPPEGKEKARFDVACSETRDMKGPGHLKQGTFRWSLKRASVIDCTCCGKAGMSLSEFVMHTDPRLMAEPQQDPYSYLYAVCRDMQHMLPLQSVMSCLRELTADPAAFAYVMDKTAGARCAPAKDPELIQYIARLRFSPVERPEKPARQRGGHSLPAQFKFVLVCSHTRYMQEVDDSSQEMRDTTSGAKDSNTFYKEFTMVTTNMQKLLHVKCSCCQKEMSLTDLIQHASVIEVPRFFRKCLYFRVVDSDHRFLRYRDVEARLKGSKVTSTSVSCSWRRTMRSSGRSVCSPSR
ncbi:hypothetical protein PINS_up016870 [Pythium insidiosum]|nr:hypothetical protein PINS_up016870 [Pythium insidiosum]